MSLLQLPPELLIRVSSHLTTPELGHLRRSCKHVEVALFDSFAREFFSKKQFMLEHVSLQALCDIANHPTLSQRLSEVVIGLHHFPLDTDYATPWGEALYNAGFVTRNVLLDTGQAHDMLAEAFSKLPNLRTVGLRDYNARGRYRDGHNASWRSYGWKSGPNYGNLETSSPNSTMPLLLCALGSAGAQPQNIHVFLRKHGHLGPASFNVVDGYMGPRVRTVLKGLKELMLAISQPHQATFGSPYLHYNENNAIDTPLKRFLHHVPDLKFLRLNFAENEFFSHRFIEWLGKPATSTHLPLTIPIAPVSLPNVTSLEIGMAKMTSGSLVNAITKFDLESLSLWKCTLLCETKADFRQNPDRWSRFFDDLASALPASTKLTKVMMGFLSQGLYTAANDDELRVHFDHPSGCSCGACGNPATIKHRAGPGTSIKDWFSSMSSRIKAEEYDSDGDSNMAEDDDENDEDDEDDDDEDMDEDD